MNVVVDANVIIAALLGSCATIEIITARNHNLCVPFFTIQEIHKHKRAICEKAHLTEKEFSENFEALLIVMNVIPQAKYSNYMSEAIALIGHRDAKDVDYIACALAVNATFIWTNDKDFLTQIAIPIKTTEQLIKESA